MHILLVVFSTSLRGLVLHFPALQDQLVLLELYACKEAKRQWLLDSQHTIDLYREGISPSLLVSTVDGTDCEGVECPQDQSRAAVVLTGAHLVTGTGGGVRVH